LNITFQILTAPAKIKKVSAVLHNAYVTCIFRQYIAEPLNSSLNETFFHSSVRLASHRVVAVKGNDRDALWQFHYGRTRSRRFV
jgi:hypothetical protein